MATCPFPPVKLTANKLIRSCGSIFGLADTVLADRSVRLKEHSPAYLMRDVLANHALNYPFPSDGLVFSNAQSQYKPGRSDGM